MNHTWCRDLDLAHCVKMDDPAPVCRITWSWYGNVHCVPVPLEKQLLHKKKRWLPVDVLDEDGMFQHPIV